MHLIPGTEPQDLCSSEVCLLIRGWGGLWSSWLSEFGSLATLVIDLHMVVRKSSLHHIKHSLRTDTTAMTHGHTTSLIEDIVKISKPHLAASPGLPVFSTCA